MVKKRRKLAAFLMCAAAWALLESPATQGQQNQTQVDQPIVRFGVEVNYVEVDAVVTDGDGRFVADLGREDFEIYEEGTLQSLSSFTLVNLTVERTQPLVFEQPVEPDVATNMQMSQGRVYIFVLDDLHTAARRSPRVRQVAREFIERRFGENDIAAVVHTSGRSDVSQEFTSNRRLLLEAVEPFLGRKLRPAFLEVLDQSVAMLRGELVRDPLELERAQRARNMLEMLQGLSEVLGDVRGRRKAMVYFGEGIDYDIYDVFGTSDATSVIRDTGRAIEEAVRANVSIYAVDPRGLTDADVESASIPGVPLDIGEFIDSPSLRTALQSAFHLSQDSLRQLSEETGGFAVLNQNDFSPGLVRIVEENSHYYLLGYSPTEESKPGSYRKIEVRVKRPSLTVKARKGYVAPESGDRKSRTASREASSDPSAILNELLESPLPLPGIPLRATASPFRTRKNQSIVPLVVEMAIDRFGFTERDGKQQDHVAFSVVALDKKGKTQARSVKEFNLSLRPKTYQLMLQAGFRVMTTLELGPGAYQLRMAVSELGAGQSGLLFYDLEVPDYGESRLVMTPLVVTSGIESRIPVIADREDRDKVLLLAATRRSFSPADTLWVLAEIYPARGDRDTPQTIDISTTLKASDAKTVFHASEERGAELSSSDEGIIHRTEIPLSGLDSGDYLLEVKARNRAGGEEEIRQVLITVL
jgi:VWFA-related protein